MQKIGIYGGTFDPIHIAHLILARDALEELQLEKIIFVPAAVSPQKPAPCATAELRLQMLRAAIEPAGPFEIDDCELRRPPPSYTIDTVEQLAKKYPKSELFFLIGDDNLRSLPGWRRFNDLRQIVTFVVLPRSISPVLHEYISVGRRIDISATEIRNRVARGQPIRYLVPEAVEEIISRECLYREVSK